MSATGELVSERIEDEFEMEDDSSADLSSEALREGGSLGEGGRTIIFWEGRPPRRPTNFPGRLRSLSVGVINPGGTSASPSKFLSLPGCRSRPAQRMRATEEVAGERNEFDDVSASGMGQ
jgi:hypothetical protein